MTSPDPLLDRRTALRTAGAALASAPLAGCLDGIVGGSGSEHAVLGPPENRERAEDLDLPYPQYGQELPDATLPAPLHDAAVSTREFVGERHVLVTFVYTKCETVCPGLTAALRRIQADAAEQGYADEVAFLPITFDPEHDTGEVLREYGEDLGVDLDAGNWYFLRPETPERAKAVVEDRFGVAFEAKGEGTGHYVHSSLILLANADGYVERAYSGGAPLPGTFRDDVRAVVEGW